MRHVSTTRFDLAGILYDEVVRTPSGWLAGFMLLLDSISLALPLLRQSILSDTLSHFKLRTAFRLCIEFPRHRSYS